jgi:hypothetical protein
MAFIGLCATQALFLQFEVCLACVSFQAAVILTSFWMLYKSTIQSIKICLYLSPIVLLGVIVLYPMINTWSAASQALCKEVLSHSSNKAAVTNCKSLVTARSILRLVLMVELALRSLWIVICFAGFRFKIALNILIAQIREQRRKERAEEMRLARERERRRKERRRKELKDKVLNRE